MNVYFDGGFYGADLNQNPCKALKLHKSFQWKGYTWRLLAPYVCEKGLVLDFAKEVPREALVRFWRKWGQEICRCRAGTDNESQGYSSNPRMDYENPMETEMWLDAWINGQKIESISGSGCSFKPLGVWEDFPALEAAEADGKARELLEYYMLPQDRGWYFYRMCLRWGENQIPSELKLRLVLKPDKWNLPCEPGFEGKTGDERREISFIHPLRKTMHKLMVESVTQEVLSKDSFAFAGNEYQVPCNFQCLHYRLLDPEDFGKFQVRDQKQSDAPIRKDGRKECGASSFFLVGAPRKHPERHGLDPGLIEQPSHMSFHPVERVSWVVDAVVCRGERLEMEWDLQEREL